MPRPLDGFERRYWLLGSVMPYTFSVVAHLRGTLDEAHLRAGLDAAQRKHPMLRARLEERPDGPWFVEDAPPIPMRLEARRGAEHWQATVEREDNARFPREGPMVRASLLQGQDEGDLLLSFHHLSADGLGAWVALRDVLAFADDAACGAPLEPKPLPIPQGMCARLPAEARGPQGQEALQGLLAELEALQGQTVVRLVPERVVPVTERVTRIVHRAFDAAATARLAARCREHGASVASLLAAVHMLALAREAGAPEPGVTGLNVPADLRGALAKPQPGQVDWAAFGLPVFHRAGPGVDVWALAREVRAGLQRPALMLRRFATLAYIDDATPRSLDAARAEVEAAEGFGLTAGSVSNLGRQGPLPPLAGVEVHGLEITGNQNIGGPTLLQVPLTWDGRLRLNFHHAEPLVGRERAARVADDVVARVREAAA